MGQLMMNGRIMCGPKVPTLKRTEVSLFLVSSSINVSNFHSIWLDTFGTDVALYIVFLLIFPVSQLAPYIVITILLTIFSMLYLFPCGYFVSTNLCFLVPSVFHLVPQIILRSGNHQFFLCIYESVSIFLVHLFCFLGSTYK